MQVTLHPRGRWHPLLSHSYCQSYLRWLCPVHVTVSDHLPACGRMCAVSDLLCIARLVNTVCTSLTAVSCETSSHSGGLHECGVLACHFHITCQLLVTSYGTTGQYSVCDLTAVSCETSSLWWSACAPKYSFQQQQCCLCKCVYAQTRVLFAVRIGSAWVCRHMQTDRGVCWSRSTVGLHGCSGVSCYGVLHMHPALDMLNSVGILLEMSIQLNELLCIYICHVHIWCVFVCMWYIMGTFFVSYTACPLKVHKLWNPQALLLKILEHA